MQTTIFERIKIPASYYRNAAKIKKTTLTFSRPETSSGLISHSLGANGFFIVDPRGGLWARCFRGLAVEVDDQVLDALQNAHVRLHAATRIRVRVSPNVLGAVGANQRFALDVK